MIKKLLLLLLCVPLIGLGQGSIIALTISPTYPTETDTVYIYASLSFASSSCPLDVKSHSILGNNIVASTQHCLGMLSAICYNTDTFKINPLSTGTYTFDLTLSSGFGGPPCTAGIVPDDYDTITFYVSPLNSGQQTYIPDDNFENYLEANGMGNGIANDDYVYTSAIDTITTLPVSNLFISDLTGVEDMVSLEILYCHYNQLTSLDISNNLNLVTIYCHGNLITTLNISGLQLITELYCSNNQITSLDISNLSGLKFFSCLDNQLTSLDVSNNDSLIDLNCSSNLINSLSLTNNTILFSLQCYNNLLTSLDVRNGNNQNINEFKTAFNPQLYCIDVDDDVWSTSIWTSGWGNIDAQHYFSTDCSVTAIEEIENSENKLLKIINVLGKETLLNKNTTLFYIYNDGTVDKKIIIE